MNFWDRERETEDLRRYIESEPNAILFVYGPKSSGKSTLLDHVIKEIKKEKKHLFAKKYQIYWFDLRGKFLPNYESVIEIFFSKQKKSSKKQRVSAVEIQEPIFKSFKVSASTLKEIKEKEIDPFEHMEEEIRKSGKKTVIVFDELQMLKDIYINGQRKVVDAFFNFFVRLTKVTHSAHVIVMSSDTFFIEEVYSNSALKNTSEFYLVDFFDDETAVKILIDGGLNEEIAKQVVSKIGGVPWMMERVMSSDDPLKKVEDLYKQSKSRIIGYLDRKRIKGEDVETTKEILMKVLSGKTFETQEELIELRKLFEAEVLFYDPLNRIVKFQTRLDKLAAKEILEG